MQAQKQVDVYTYSLNIISISMKIKFPCKMSIEYNGKSLTTEVGTANNKFIFNQEASIKNETDKEYFEIVVNLQTDKGSKYVGGVVRLQENQLIRSEGEHLVIPISKCIDTDSFCQLRVDQVSTSRIMRKVSPKRKHALRSEYQPEMKVWQSGKHRPIKDVAETKSQFNFPLSVAGGHGKNWEHKHEMRKKMGASKLYEGDKETVNLNFPNSLEFEVYRDGYNKLKQKYRKQSETARLEMNKRIALEANENNLKLENIRLKLKSEELQKSLHQKNSKLKDANENLTCLQKKQLDIKYLRQEIQNNQFSIKSLEETIATLTRDNNELKALNDNKVQNEQEVIRELKEDNYSLKRDFQNRESEILKELRGKNELISKKEFELRAKAEEMDRERLNIEDLEKTISNKIFEHEKIMQQEKNSAARKYADYQAKIDSNEKEKQSFEQLIKSLSKEIEKGKSDVVRVEYDKKILLQTNESLSSELEQLKITRDKYMDLLRENKIVIDEKSHFEKLLEKTVRNKDASLEEVTSKFQGTTQSLKKTLKEQEDKLKNIQLRYIQSESQCQMQKNHLEKAKRQNESIAKQNSEIKASLKEIKVDLKSKEQKILSLTNQLAEYRSKNQHSSLSWKLEIDKIKQEYEKTKRELDNETSKYNQLSQKHTNLEIQFNKFKMQTNYAQEKTNKENGYAKDKINGLEALNKDCQAQISTLTQTISNMKQYEKTLTDKVQALELGEIKNSEKLEKSKKEIKLLEEKLHQNDITLKNKVSDIAHLEEVKESLEKKNSELEVELAQSKSEMNKELGEKNKNQKIIEILQDDKKKSKQQQGNLNETILKRDKVEEDLRQEIKKNREDHTRLEMKLSGLKKEYQKFKETLVDNTHSIFNAIPAGAEGVSHSRNTSAILSTEKNLSENSQIFSLLTNYGKEVRNNMTKLVEQFKHSQRELEKLSSDYSHSVNKCHSTEFEFNQNIQQLNEEISELQSTKVMLQNHHEQQLFTLEGKIREKDSIIQQLSLQIEELDFNLKNVRMELDSNRQDFSKKDQSQRKVINQLRQQIQYHSNEIMLLQNALEKAEQQLSATNNLNSMQDEEISKKDKSSAQLEQVVLNYESANDELRRQKKKNLQKIQELSLYLSTEKEEKEKLKEGLTDEQKKLSQLRQYLNIMMKQKEEVIKRQLEKSEDLLDLENQISELKHQNQYMTQQIKKLKSSEDQLKQSNKKYAKSVKDDQASQYEEKIKYNKIQEKLKEKEKEILNQEESYSKLDERFKKDREKLHKDVKELEEEIEELHLKGINKDKQYNQKIIDLQNQNQRMKLSIEQLKEQTGNQQQLLYINKSKYEATSETLKSSESQNIQLKQRLKFLETAKAELEDQAREKQEELYRVQGKIYNLENKLEIKEVEKNDKIENINNDWENKYQLLCEEYEQRLQVVEKQKDFLKKRLQEVENQNSKQISELRNQQSTLTSNKKSFEDRLKAFEEERLTLIAQKNIQFQRLTEENKKNFQNLKNKQSQVRKITSELQLAKNSINKLEIKLKQSEQKFKNVNRNYLEEVQELKKKQNSYKKFKETVVNSVWKSQREVRKNIQTFVKKLLQNVDQKSMMKVLEITKNIQQSIIASISIKVQ